MDSLTIAISITTIITFALSIYTFGRTQDKRQDDHEQKVDSDIREIMRLLAKLEGQILMITEQHNRFLLTKQEDSNGKN